MFALLLVVACSSPGGADKPGSGTIEDDSGAASDSDPDQVSDGGSGDDDSGPSGSDGSDGSDDTAPHIPQSCIVELETTPKNVLMISIDTLRRDAIGRYGGGDNTDFLDKLMDEGLALDDHRSCSNWTYASILCTLTGRYNEENDFFPIGGGRQAMDDTERAPPLRDDIPTMADWAREQGFISGLISANGFFDTTYNTGSRYDSAEIAIVAAGDIVDGALAIADEELLPDGRPWFLHAHFLDPHTPYNPPGTYVNDELRDLPSVAWDLRTSGGLLEAVNAFPTLTDKERAAIRAHLAVLYGGEVAYLDDQVERMFEGLNERGMLDDTLVVLWSDHGEQFFDHSGFGHHVDLYTEETHALGAFWSRSMVEPLAWSEPTSPIDIVPTVACLMDLPAFESSTGAPVGESRRNRPRFASTLHDTWSQSSVERDGLRLVYRWSGSKELFNLSEDPGEKSNRIDVYRDEADALWELLLPFVEIADPLNPYQSAGISPP